MNTVLVKHLFNKLAFCIFVVFIHFSCNPESGNSNNFWEKKIAQKKETTGVWKLVKRIHLNKRTQITSYDSQPCPSIIKITADTLTNFETVTVSSISGQCYFGLRSHYNYVEGIGIVKSADTIVPYFFDDTLALSRKIVIKNTGVNTEISMYTVYHGQIPPKDYPCYCGDSVFTALSH